MASYDLTIQLSHGFTLKDLRTILKKVGAYPCMKDYLINHVTHILSNRAVNIPDDMCDANGKINFASVKFWSNEIKNIFNKETIFLNDYFEKAQECFSQIIIEGWMVETENGYFEATRAGNSLRMMSTMKRKSRKHAEIEMADFLSQIKSFNALGIGYQIDSAYVFGSYLTNSETLGDLDIAIEYSRTYKLPKTEQFSLYKPPEALLSKYLELGYKEGQEWVRFIERFIFRFLRKSRFISLCHLQILNHYIAEGRLKAAQIYLNPEAQDSITRASISV
ncbi:nucleotidyltransferase domain-containing protein [Paraglaciecola sp.]|uniref:nucleotidyltransferase domain-containing protein n=1 Tax=Paraglaciecola sp. TaxID=1920173 RepID=UPI0030F3D9F9